MKSKPYKWQLFIFDDDGEVEAIHKFKNVHEIMAHFPLLTNKYTIYNLANGKYKLNSVGRISQETLDFYNSIKIIRIGDKNIDGQK